MANAYAAFEEDNKGSITVGKLADFVILDHNIVTCPEDQILDTKVIYTILNGKVVFDAKEI
jgi:predicted amidohydrolase YtcJ